MAGPWFETSLCLSLPIQVTTMYPVSNDGVLRGSDTCFLWWKLRQASSERGVQILCRGHGPSTQLIGMTEDGFHSQTPLLLVSWLLWGFAVVPPALTTCRQLRWEAGPDHRDVSGKRYNKETKQVHKTCKIDGVVTLVLGHSGCGGTFVGKEQYDEELLTEPAWETWEDFTLWMVITITSVTLRQ